MPHTPGPWQWTGHDENYGTYSSLDGPAKKNEHGKDYWNPVVRSVGYDEPELSIDAADARLIAQAPAMYELLKELELSKPNGHFLECPVCKGEIDDPKLTRGICVSALGHEPDCRLSAVIKAVEGE